MLVNTLMYWQKRIRPMITNFLSTALRGTYAFHSCLIHIQTWPTDWGLNSHFSPCNSRDTVDKQLEMAWFKAPQRANIYTVGQTHPHFSLPKPERCPCSTASGYGVMVQNTLNPLTQVNAAIAQVKNILAFLRRTFQRLTRAPFCQSIMCWFAHHSSIASRFGRHTALEPMTPSSTYKKWSLGA